MDRAWKGEGDNISHIFAERFMNTSLKIYVHVVDS